MTAADRAKAHDGTFLLRIEDIDQARSRPEWEAQILEDLRWLGICWPEPVLRQSERLPAYRDALDRLAQMGVCYPCRCTRRDIRAALSAPQESLTGDSCEGPVYPGTCRDRLMSEAGANDSIRLNVAAAIKLVERRWSMASPVRRSGASDGLAWVSGEKNCLNPLAFTEVGPVHAGTYRIEKEAILSGTGDIVLARRDIGTSYHLAVVVDDAFQGVTEIVRGEDLFEATFIHTLLQELLAFPRPVYFHHSLVRDDMGRRLAKRDDARSLARYRSDGLTPSDVRRMVSL